MGGVFSFASPAEGTRQRLAARVEQIHQAAAALRGRSDGELQEMAAELRQRARGRESLDELLGEAFALVQEASARVLGMRHYDSQLMCGIVLHEGAVAEMATGEGKSLAAILPAFLNSLAGEGVYIVTTNDYLARRDAEEVGQPLRFLGTSVGVVQAGMGVGERQRAYSSDVTYVTNVQLGFDYLGDQLATSRSELVQRLESPFSFAIVDEADSVMIDEARVPLVISSKAAEPSEKYMAARRVAERLRAPLHYTLEEKQRMCALTEEGAQEAVSQLGVTDLFDPEDPWAPFLLNAINAKEFFAADRHYLIRDGRVVIVDEFTGRAMEGRRWNDGLHQAVEAKEGVRIEAEAMTLASISYQSFFRLFRRLAGMTGTATTEAKEFEEIYRLPVVPVPTNLPCQRRDEEDEVYFSDAAKWAAVASEVSKVHSTGRPVLVGTTSVENSEAVSERLKQLGVPHNVLNARPDNAAREAEIIAGSGRRGAVTISTNMAGRGTDIVLGGSSATMARLRLRDALFSRLYPSGGWSWPTQSFYPVALSAPTEAALEEAAELAAASWAGSVEGQVSELEAEFRLATVCDSRAKATAPASAAEVADAKLQGAYGEVRREFEAVVAAEREEVVRLGGLHVLGTERHESRRIDAQLRGRCGRQGDPGSTRFFLSLSDNVFRVFGGDTIKSALEIGGPEGLSIPSGLLGGALDEAQKQVESYYFGMRKEVFEYDDVMDQQRKGLYGLRRRVLLGADEELEGTMYEFNETNMVELAAEIAESQPVSGEALEKYAEKITAWFSGCFAVTPEELRRVADGGLVPLKEWLLRESRAAILAKEKSIEEPAPGLHHAVRRQILLQQVDKFWRRHLQNMRFIMSSAKLRGFGQRDPLVEYKLEGYEAYVGMMSRIRRNAVGYLFLFMPQPLEALPLERADALAAALDAAGAGGGAGAGGAAEQPMVAAGDVNGGVASAGIVDEVRRRLALLQPRGGRSGPGRGLLGFAELSQILGEAGLKGHGAQLRWAAKAEGLELLEDVYAKAVYVGARDDH